MRHPRPFAALLAIAALAVACSGPPGSSSGAGSSDGGTASQGGGASEPAASSGGGGGGGGGTGANGSVSYEITGDVSKSGDLDFAYIAGGVSQFVEGGWVAYFYSDDTKTVVTINSNPQSNIVLFGDEEIVVTGTADTGCTFDYSQNDASGLKGTIDCSNTIATTVTGTQIHVDIHVEVDAHT
jgi:hypothetical protein